MFLQRLFRYYISLMPITVRTFVNGRARDVIMVDMRRRIDRADFNQEVQDNIEVCQPIFKGQIASANYFRRCVISRGIVPRNCRSIDTVCQLMPRDILREHIGDTKYHVHFKWRSCATYTN